MSAISLNRRLLFRIACFAVGMVCVYVVLEMSGVQRVSSWVILVSWLLMVLVFCIFGNRQAR